MRQRGTQNLTVRVYFSGNQKTQLDTKQIWTQNSYGKTSFIYLEAGQSRIQTPEKLK